ncbi:hypothetical protein, partial [Proteus mirabilis]|uniref:hypothetical protein n=1 Tax=Proteus mirabilis TaxID=584 RepID=UPI001C131884
VAQIQTDFSSRLLKFSGLGTRRRLADEQRTIEALASLLREGTPREKKDAVTLCLICQHIQITM